MSCYYLTLRDSQDEFIQLMPKLTEDDNKVIPLFTIPLLFNMSLEQGWKILSSNCAFCKDAGADSEIIPLDFSKDTKLKIARIMKYQGHTSISPDMFFKIRVFKDRTELTNDDTGFTYDLSNPEHAYVQINDVNTKSTYRIIILIHSEYINKFITEINGFDKET